MKMSPSFPPVEQALEGHVQEIATAATRVRHANGSNRATFPPAGLIKPPRSGQTAHEKFQGALARLSASMRDLEKAKQEVEEVVGIDGSSPVDTDGVAKHHCDAWIEVLKHTEEAVVVWRATWNRRHRNAGRPVDARAEEPIDEDEDSDTIAAECDDEAGVDVLDREVTS